VRPLATHDDFGFLSADPAVYSMTSPQTSENYQLSLGISKFVAAIKLEMLDFTWRWRSSCFCFCFGFRLLPFFGSIKNADLFCLLPFQGSKSRPERR